LLVPGFTGSKEDFLEVLPLLARAGWDAAAYDQLGQYESPQSKDEADYALPLLAGDLGDIATSLAGPVHVVGHSFGGLVVATAVSSRPDLFASVALVACGLGPLSEPLASSLAPFLFIPDGTPSREVWQIRLQAQGPLDPGLSPEIATFVQEKFIASPLAAMKAKLRILLAGSDLTADLAATGKPFYVATGEFDDYWALERQREVAYALGTSLHLLAGCGHSPNVDDPEQLARELGQFWTSSHS
jgi:pimeloyl-ACP methyl ester carboxylesterase